MRVIVTGATGFLGGALCRRLLARGDAVTAIGRQRPRLERLTQLGCTALALDLSAANARPELPPNDVMIHAAALSSPWGQRQAFIDANIQGTRTALGLARQAQVKRLVHISTPSVYFRFADQFLVSEDQTLPPPVNDYAWTKRCAEELVLAAPDLRPIILRPRGIYGTGDTTLLPRLLSVARKRALPLFRGGRAATDLTHVDDVVDAILAAMAVPEQVSNVVVNVSGGEALPIREIVTRIGARFDVPVRWRPMPVSLALVAARLLEAQAQAFSPDKEPLVTMYGLGLFAYSQTLDLTRARDLLGWVPKVCFADGLARTELAPS